MSETGTEAIQHDEPEAAGYQALAQMAPDTVVDAETLSRLLGTCRKTIERAPGNGHLPAPFRHFKKNVWLAGAIVEHFRAKQSAAIQQAAQHARKISAHSV